MADAILPQHSDMLFTFSPITKNGSDLDFATIQYWHFAMSSGLGYSPFITKASNGVVTSGDFTITAASDTVSVSVLASGFNASGGRYGNYYIALYAETSGSYITHLQKTVQIQQQIARI